MPGSSSPSTKNHLTYLDSARGIAALMVFASHFIGLFLHDKMNVHYLFLIFNGNDAVSFFFVLSGFVLSYKYLVLDKPLDIKKYYVTRIFRIFPAYFIAVTISALMANREQMNLNTLTDLFILNKRQFWEEALLFRLYNKYLIVGWSLTIEMGVSLIIPFFVALAIRDKKLISYLIVVLLVIGVYFCNSLHFLFGVLIACYFSKIRDASFKETKWYKYRYAILPLAFVLFSLRHIDAIAPLGSMYNYLAGYLSVDFFVYSGIAAFVFLVAIIHSRSAQKFLEKKPLIFMGKISYGVYLVHVTLLNYIYYFFTHYDTPAHHILLLILAVIIYFMGTLVAATLMHYLIELPFIRVGKRIVGRMKPSLIISREPNQNQ